MGVRFLSHVDSLIPDSGRGPIERGGHPLPDDPPRDPSKVQWGGAFDGLAAVGRVKEEKDNTRAPHAVRARRAEQPASPSGAEEAIFDLAPQVEGWGRIHAILRLKNTDTPDIRAWMVRGGASIEPWLTEEIAHVAANTGRPREAVTGEIDETSSMRPASCSEHSPWVGRLRTCLTMPTVPSYSAR